MPQMAGRASLSMAFYVNGQDLVEIDENQSFALKFYVHHLLDSLELGRLCRKPVDIELSYYVANPASDRFTGMRVIHGDWPIK